MTVDQAIPPTDSTTPGLRGRLSLHPLTLHRVPRRACALAASALALGLVAGCASSNTSTAVTQTWVTTLAPQPTTAGAASASNAPIQQSSATDAASLGTVLQQVAVQTKDLGSGFSVALITDGDQIDGQVTLDNCGYNFTTEDHRVARRQYRISGVGGAATGISNELVAYDSADQAALALTQWNTAAATCPSTPVTSSAAGVPPLTIKVSRNDLNVTTLPTTNNAVTIESQSANGQTQYLLSILQVKGRYLDNIYASSAVPFTASVVANVMSTATATGNRLASLK